LICGREHCHADKDRPSPNWYSTIDSTQWVKMSL
jgi:hypothetical protein